MEQDGIARTELLAFYAELKPNTPTTMRSAPQWGEAKLTLRIACKCERGRLERVVGVGGDNLANVSDNPVSQDCTLVTPANRFRSLHTRPVVCSLPFSSRSGQIP